MATASNWKIPSPRECRKAIIGFLNLAAVVLTLALAQGDVIPEGYVKFVALALGVMNAVGVFRVPNDKAKGTPPEVAADLSVRG